MLACFDDDLCEHDFPTIVGLPRDDFFALAADCEVIDAESVRAGLFHARVLEDSVRHSKLLTFVLDHMDMVPTRRDAEALQRGLAAPSGACDLEFLNELLARVRAVSPPARPRTGQSGPGRRGRRLGH